MRVSVVIPTYNSGPLVVEAVSSALAQTRPPHEVIVIDDGSTDDTAARLAPFGDRIRYIRQENAGVSAARNRGVAESTGEIIGFLDADDVWHPLKLEFQLAALAAHPHLGLLGTESYSWPASEHPRPAESTALLEYTQDQLLVRNRLTTSTVLVRTEMIRRVGEFDRTLQGPEDYDMWLRVARTTAIGVLPVPLAGYRAATPHSLSKQAVRMEHGLRQILDRLETEGVFRRRPVLKRKAWAYFRYNCGLMYRDAGFRITAAVRFAQSLGSWPLSLEDSRGQPVPRFPMLLVTVRQLLPSRGVAPR